MWRVPRGSPGYIPGPMFCAALWLVAGGENRACRVKGVGLSLAGYLRLRILREMNLESYVRPVELCQRPRGGASVKLIKLPGSGTGGWDA